MRRNQEAILTAAWIDRPKYIPILPNTLRMFASFLYGAEDYGDAQQNMRDIASIFYRSSSVLLMGENLRNDMIDALNDAVVYCVRGSGRSEARGLSFCYATDFSNEELETYAHNCMSAHYLALLDAITSWTAPDWVYETVERLPEISALPFSGNGSKAASCWNVLSGI